MKYLELINIFYRPNKDVPEYKDIYFELNIGFVKIYGTKLLLQKFDNLQLEKRLNELDELKNKYGKLYITDARGTYDNNLYLLISGKFILAIEYILNSNFDHSIQDFRIIEDLNGANKVELDEFKELETVELPALSD